MAKLDRETEGAESVAQLAALANVFGDLFARLFPAALANFVMELHASLQARGAKLSDLDPEEVAKVASQKLAIPMRKANEIDQECERGDLASAPQRGRRTGREGTETDTPIEVKPSEIRKNLIRNRLLLALKEQGMTQAELAKKLGKPDSQISRILACPERSKLTTLTEIAQGISVDLSEIVRDFGPMPQNE